MRTGLSYHCLACALRCCTCAVAKTPRISHQTHVRALRISHLCLQSTRAALLSPLIFSEQELFDVIFCFQCGVENESPLWGGIIGGFFVLFLGVSKFLGYKLEYNFYFYPLGFIWKIRNKRLEKVVKGCFCK